MIDARFFGHSKYQAQTVRMIVKNQNVLNVLASGRICRLPDDEDPFHGDARLFAWRRISGQTSLRISEGPDEGCRKDYPSTVRAFPFHESRYDQRPYRRYGACVGFFRATCGVILTPSFEIDQSSPDEHRLDDQL